MSQTNTWITTGRLTAILLLALLVAACGPELPTPAASMQSPIKTPVATPTPAEPRPTRPPLCSPLSSSPPTAISEASPLSFEDFHFSEPQVVLSDSIAIDISDWLPDNQHLLIARPISGTNEQVIETFNVYDGQLREYGRQNSGSRIFFWLPQSKSAAYLVSEWENREQGILRYNLKVNQGDPSTSQTILQDVPLSTIAIDPNGALLLFADAPTLPPEAQSFFQIHSLPVNPTRLKYSKYRFPVNAHYLREGFEAAQRPQGDLIALHNEPYLFLANAVTGQVCEVDLGWQENLPRWPLYVRWSPDGRYLAMPATARLPGDTLDFTDLTVFDTVTGKAHQIDTDMLFVWDIAWATDSQHLLLLGRNWNSWIQKLALLDLTTNELHSVLSDHAFGGGTPGLQLAWSSDGSRLAVKCPEWSESDLVQEDRICLVSVDMSRGREVN